MLRRAPAAGGACAIRLRPGPGGCAAAQRRVARGTRAAGGVHRRRLPARREWLERALDAADANPGAIVQGATRPDPDEVHLVAAPARAHQRSTLPTHGRRPATSSIRARCSSAGGFEEACRGRGRTPSSCAGRGARGRPTWARPTRSSTRRRGRLAARQAAGGPALAGAGARRRATRGRATSASGCSGPSHARLAGGARRLAAARRRPAARAVLPWLRRGRARPTGTGARPARAVRRAPGRAAVDAVEMAALAAGRAALPDVLPVIEVCVVVASHDRPLRLRWLLNALEEQTLGRGRFEVVVAHDSSAGDRRAAARRTRSRAPARCACCGSTAAPARRAAQRGVARGARPARRLHRRRLPARRRRGSRGGGGAAREPGRDRPGRDAARSRRSGASCERRLAHDVDVEPPVPWAQTCNILYPRAVLEGAAASTRAALAAGEDTDLAQRARRGRRPRTRRSRTRSPTTRSTPGAAGRCARAVRRWRAVPAVVKRHPSLREGCRSASSGSRATPGLALAMLGARPRPPQAVARAPGAALERGGAALVRGGRARRLRAVLGASRPRGDRRG